MSSFSVGRADPDAGGDKREQILDAAMALLADGGIAAVSMRAIAREAGVSLGLINYHFADKDTMVAATLERIGDQDASLVVPEPGLPPASQLRHALRRVVDEEFLRPEYLGLRLQLWSLATVDRRFAMINKRAQMRYRAGLAQLIAGVRPRLPATDLERRAADILIVQNGIWLTSILIADRDAIERSVQACEALAFAGVA